jgi:hypothetical protein
VILELMRKNSPANSKLVIFQKLPSQTETP